MERDDILADCLNDGEDFNSHAHVERDGTFHASGFNVYDFNSHAHVERDLLLLMLFSMFSHFNSHAHVERDMYSTNFH